jgi:hypothetical protein
MQYNSNCFHRDLTIKDAKLIPFSGPTTRQHEISFKGWQLSYYEDNYYMFNEIIEIASESIKIFIKLYKNEYAFTEPHFTISPEGIFTVKIGMLELDTYKEKYEKDCVHRDP